MPAVFGALRRGASERRSERQALPGLGCGAHVIGAKATDAISHEGRPEYEVRRRPDVRPIIANGQTASRAIRDSEGYGRDSAAEF